MPIAFDPSQPFTEEAPSGAATVTASSTSTATFDPSQPFVEDAPEQAIPQLSEYHPTIRQRVSNFMWDMRRSGPVETVMGRTADEMAAIPAAESATTTHDAGLMGVFENKTPPVTLYDNPQTVSDGVHNLAAGVVNSVLSPGGLATLELGAAPKIIQKAVGVAFGAQGVKMGYDSFKTILGDAKLNPAQKVEAIGQLILGGLMTAGGVHAARGKAAVEQAPETAKPPVLDTSKPFTEEAPAAPAPVAAAPPVLDLTQPFTEEAAPVQTPGATPAGSGLDNLLGANGKRRVLSMGNIDLLNQQPPEVQAHLGNDWQSVNNGNFAERVNAARVAVGVDAAPTVEPPAPSAALPVPMPVLTPSPTDQPTAAAPTAEELIARTTADADRQHAEHLAELNKPLGELLPIGEPSPLPEPVPNIPAATSPQAESATPLTVKAPAAAAAKPIDILPGADQSKAAGAQTITGSNVREGTEMPAEPGAGASLIPGANQPSSKLGARVQRSLDRPYDLIDHALDNVGKIDPALIREADPNWQPVGAARQLFKTGGTPADVAANDLASRGAFKGDPGQPDQLGAALNAAARGRKGDRSTAGRESQALKVEARQAEQFSKRVLQGQRPKADAGKIERVPVDTLTEGDTFEAQGHKFTVKQMEWDEDGRLTNVTLKDGPKFGVQQLEGSEMLHLDKGSLVTKGQAVEFLPPEDAAATAEAAHKSITALFGNEAVNTPKGTKLVPTPKLRTGEKGTGSLLQGDEPFNLAGERGVDVERLAKEKAAKEAAAKANAEFQAKNTKDLFDGGNEVAGFGGSGVRGRRRGPVPAPAPVPRRTPGPIPPTPPPATGAIKTWLQNASSGFKRVFAPHTIDTGSADVANILREVNGEKANELARADEAMHQWRREFDRSPVPNDWTHDPARPLPHNYAVIDAMERDRTALPARYQPLANYFDQAFKDRIKVIQHYAPQALRHLITNYFPHVWRDPDRAAGVMEQVATKLFAGRKEFLKERSLPFFADGLERGLKPISDNPVDLLLAKMHSMDKFIAALKAQAEFKAIGKMKFKYALEGMPEGWQKIDDPSFIIHAPPVVTITEAFDSFQRAKLGELMHQIGVSYKRVASLGGSRWAEADRGMKEIRAKTGADESILWHELGHQADWKFPNLRNSLPMRGNSPIAKQLRALVDLRGEGMAVSSSTKKYFRETPEKMAEIFRAYVHAPDLFRATAPDVLNTFTKWLDTEPKFRDTLNEMRRGRLAIGDETTQHKLGGVLKLGDWIMPEGPAQVVKNYLSPGLSHSGVYRSVRAASNLMNACQLGLSGFHVGFTSLDAVVSTVEVGLHQLLHGSGRGLGTLAKAPFAPVTNYFTGKAVQRAMLDPGATVPAEIRKIADMAVKGGLRATVDPFWQTHQTRNLVRSIHEGGLAWAKTPLQAPLALVEQTMRPITEFLVPRQKLGVFALLAKSEMERLPAMASPEAVRAAMARAADATEDRMGQMTYDNLFYNRMAKDLALLSFRAYGWQLGKYRHLFGAAGDTVAGARQLTAGKLPDLTHRQLYFLALPLVVGAVGGMLHKLFSGQNPQSAMDYFHPSTGQTDQNGNPKRLSLPSYMKDLEADYAGLSKGYAQGGVVGAGQGLWSATYHRLNPAASIVVDMLGNKDFYGTQIWDPQDGHLKQLGEQAAFIAKSMVPFSIAGAQKLSQGQASTRDKVLPFIGITPANKVLTMTPLESFYAEQFRSTLPAGARTAEQSEAAQLRSKLVQDLKAAKAGGPGVTNIEARILAAGVKNSQALTRLAQKAELLPIQYQANYLPLVPAMRGFDLASDKEKAALAPILIPRVNRAGTTGLIPPETASHFVKQLAPYYKPGMEE